MKRQNVMNFALVATLFAGAVAPMGKVSAMEEAKAKEAREAALAAVEGYTESESLQLGVDVVESQLPQTKIYWDMGIGADEVSGNGYLLKLGGALDNRNPDIMAGAGVAMLNDLARVAIAVDLAKGTLTLPEGNVYNYYGGCWQTESGTAGCYTMYDDTFEGSTITYTYYDTASTPAFGALIKEAMELDAYKTAAMAADDGTDFKTFIDMAKTVYDRGMKSLRDGITTIDKAPAEDADGEALLAAYEALPEVAKYDTLVEKYNTARSILTSYDSAIKNITNEEYKKSYLEYITTTYGDLAVAAAEIQEDFVDKIVAEVAARAAEDAAEAEKKDVKAPNTGFLGSEAMGTIAKAAVGAVASVAATAGIIVTAKRWIFSPLKRRK